MALDGESPQLERVAKPQPGRLPAALIGLAALFVAVALLKPWGGASIEQPGPGNHARRPVPATTAPAHDNGQAGVAGIFFRQCYPTSNWRLTAVQRSGALTVRTVWPAAARFDATLPPDGGVPSVAGAGVEGIGFCAPGDERAARLARAAAVTLWRRTADGRIVPVDGASVIDVPLAGEGEVYLAPPPQLATDGAWPAGDYFFEISPSRSGSSATWLALQVVALPGSSPSPALPTVPAAASGRSSLTRPSAAHVFRCIVRIGNQGAHPHAEEAGDVPYLASGAGRYGHRPRGHRLRRSEGVAFTRRGGHALGVAPGDYPVRSALVRGQARHLL